MLDLLARDTEISILILSLAFLIVLPIQLFLCYKAKKLLIKLIPTITLSATVIAFYSIVFVIKDRTAIRYALFGLF